MESQPLCLICISDICFIRSPRCTQKNAAISPDFFLLTAVLFHHKLQNMTIREESNATVSENNTQPQVILWVNLEYKRKEDQPKNLILDFPNQAPTLSPSLALLHRIPAL